MKVLLINHTCGIGSTGRICAEIAQRYVSEGHEAIVAYGRGEVPERYRAVAKHFGSNWNLYAHVLHTRVTDKHGFASQRATRELLQWAEDYNPDILWLHNIHGYYINVELLFAWIKSRPGMEVKWTLHDCWAFTGHCSYFTLARCDQWKTHCERCVQSREYPASLLRDNCRDNFERKRKAFTGVEKMTLITPSQWLADLVKQSFLAEYPVEVHYNTIDTNIFKPTPGNFREKYHLEGKTIILGVANVWHERKGLDDFLQLASMLDERFVIVLVGLTQKEVSTRSQQVPLVPSEEAAPASTGSGEVLRTPTGTAIEPKVQALRNAILEHVNGKNAPDTGSKGACPLLCIPRTSSVSQLAEIYTAADIFCNPTHEDNYPTTNLEAQACGTWVITYDVGGSRETLYPH